jgi:hypothetical protein
MKTIVQGFVMTLVAAAALQAGAQSYEWQPRESLVIDPAPAPPRMRLDEANKRLDDLRDNATADDYRTIRVQGKNGRGAYRRVPTEEFAARIERAEFDRDVAEAELKLRERSLY